MKRSLLAPALAALALACGPSGPETVDPGTIPFEPKRPTPGGAAEVAPYSGTNADVLTAQQTYPTGLELHRKLVMRTCSGTNGVCHNQKEYPDLHTPGTFTASIGAPCNVQSGNAEGVFDRCERLGDRFRFAEQSFREIEVGYFELILGETPEFGTGQGPDASTPGLHLYLHDPVPVTQARLNATGTFIRTFVNEQGNVQTLPFASYETTWWVLGDKKHLFARVNDNQRDTVEGLVASGIVQGDQNRNGVYGARILGNTVPLINPGKPEQSYLVARLRGYMERETAPGTRETVPGTRMPLANQPPNVPDMLALMCFIEGLDPAATQWNLGSAIDYNKCSYKENPAALSLAGTGDSWTGRVLPILQSNCGGCHGGSNPQAGLDLLTGTAEEVRQRLLKPSTQNPAVQLVLPGNLDRSYLFLKLTGESSISGSRMPINPLNGNAALPDAELKSIENWIFLYGASGT
jgi:mono/diheme cytochrome c family protein